MEQVPVRITYHRQKSSTGRIRGGQIHLRISNLVSRREQARHVEELTEKMVESWGRLGDAKERISLASVFDEIHGRSEMLGIKEHKEYNEFKEAKDSKDFKDLKEREVGVYPGLLRMSTGVEYKVKIKKGKNRKVKIEKMGNQLVVVQPVDRVFDADEAEKVLWTFLAKDQVSVLEDRLNGLREGWIHEEFSVLKLKQVMTRWGSCEKRRWFLWIRSYWIMCVCTS
jgi:hypothetical protein